ncbi:uncharacterized protein LOC134204793 isoform X2 [Armigeres subalbatus]|uniref:uncharacterized protein LOC134204793 isoform X2 n=1 Tax=Armigeres subalbatus TaxID=124917 RepID=UPI002ED37221
MHPRRKRNYFLSPSYEGKKYEKKVKLNPRLPFENITNGASENSESRSPLHDASNSCLVQPPEEPSMEPISCSGNIFEMESSTPSPIVTNEPSLERNFNNSSSETDTDQPYFLKPNSPAHDKSSSWDMFFKIFSGKNTEEKFQTTSDILTIEIMYMILNYYIRHSLTQEALEDLLRMMNIISGKKFLPETFQTFSMLFEGKTSTAQRVYICTNYLGKLISFCLFLLNLN